MDRRNKSSLDFAPIIFSPHPCFCCSCVRYLSFPKVATTSTPPFDPRFPFVSSHFLWYVMALSLWQLPQIPRCSINDSLLFVHLPLAFPYTLCNPDSPRTSSKASQFSYKLVAFSLQLLIECLSILILPFTPSTLHSRLYFTYLPTKSGIMATVDFTAPEYLDLSFEELAIEEYISPFISSPSQAVDPALQNQEDGLPVEDSDFASPVDYSFPYIFDESTFEMPSSDEECQEISQLDMDIQFPVRTERLPGVAQESFTSLSSSNWGQAPNDHWMPGFSSFDEAPRPLGFSSGVLPRCSHVPVAGTEPQQPSASQPMLVGGDSTSTRHNNTTTSRCTRPWLLHISPRRLVNDLMLDVVLSDQQQGTDWGRKWPR